jgi:hypothetical protein
MKEREDQTQDWSRDKHQFALGLDVDRMVVARKDISLFGIYLLARRRILAGSLLRAMSVLAEYMKPSFETCFLFC